MARWWKRLTTEVEPFYLHNGATFLSVDGVCKRFGSHQALQDVGFEIGAGEFITFLGPSGCGKTTLLRIIAGLELADTGCLSLGGRDITALPAHRRPVNTVFQSLALFPHYNVFDNVAFGLRARGARPADVDRRVADTLKLVRLQDLAHRRTTELSGGQRQRVALARALVNEPLLLLLDEPLSALDAQLRADMQMELRALQRRLGTTFILVTHDQHEAMAVSDRIFVMNEARIEQSGTPDEVYERPRTRFVAAFLGSANLIAASRSGSTLGVETVLGTLQLRQAPPWSDGTLSIRPERIRLCDTRPQVNGVEATVVDVIFRGDHCEARLSLGDVRLQTAPSAALRPGERVWIQLPPEHIEALHD